MVENASGLHPMLPYFWIDRRFRWRKNSKRCPRCIKNIAQNIDIAFDKFKAEINKMWTQIVSELSDSIIPSQWSFKLWSAHVIVYVMFSSLIPCNDYIN
jgi:hypothetical protein